MKIAVIGKVSFGKSSFINSFYTHFNGGHFIPIANVSLQRETFNPIEYIFNTEVKNNIDNYLQISQQNKNIRQSGKMPELNIEQHKVYSFSDKIISLTDWPGFDDNNDNRGCFDYFINNIEKYNIVIFITSADRAFVEKSEVEHFNKIHEKIKENLNAGVYCKLITILTKYDDDDEDLNEIYSYIPRTEGIEYFRWSSYNILSKCFIPEPEKLQKIFSGEFKKIMRMKTNTFNGDVDGFILYLNKFDINVEYKNCIVNFAKKTINEYLKDIVKIYDNNIYEKEICLTFYNNNIEHLIKKYKCKAITQCHKIDTRTSNLDIDYKVLLRYKKLRDKTEKEYYNELTQNDVNKIYIINRELKKIYDKFNKYEELDNLFLEMFYLTGIDINVKFTQHMYYIIRKYDKNYIPHFVKKIFWSNFLLKISHIMKYELKKYYAEIYECKSVNEELAEVFKLAQMECFEVIEYLHDSKTILESLKILKIDKKKLLRFCYSWPTEKLEHYLFSSELE